MAEFWEVSKFMFDITKDDPNIQSLIVQINEQIKKKELLQQQYESECEENVRLKMQSFHLEHIVNEKSNQTKDLQQLHESFQRMLEKQIILNRLIQNIEFEKIAAYDILVLDLKQQDAIKEEVDERLRKAKLLEELNNREIVKQRIAMEEKLSVAREQLKQVQNYVKMSERHRANSIRRHINRRNDCIVRLVQGARDLELLRKEVSNDEVVSIGSEEIKNLEERKKLLLKELSEIEKHNATLEMTVNTSVPNSFLEVSNSEDKGNTTSFERFSPSKVLNDLKSDFYKSHNMEDFFSKAIEQIESTEIVNEDKNMESGAVDTEKTSESNNHTVVPLVIPEKPIKHGSSESNEDSVNHSPQKSLVIPKENIKHVNFDLTNKSPDIVEEINLITPTEENEMATIENEKKTTTTIEILENRLIKSPHKCVSEMTVTADCDKKSLEQVQEPPSSADSEANSNDQFDDFMTVFLKPKNIPKKNHGNSKIESSKDHEANPESKKITDLQFLEQDETCNNSKVDSDAHNEIDDILQTSNDFVFDFNGTPQSTENFL